MSVSNAVNILGTFISYLNVALIYCKITKLKFKPNLIFWMLLIMMSGINVLVIPLLPLFIKPIASLIFLATSIYLISKTNLKNVIYYVFTIWFVGVFLDILFMTLFSLVFQSVLQNHPNIGLSIISIILQLLLNLFFRIRFVNKAVIKIKEKYDSVKGIIWIFLLLIFLIVLFGIFVFTKRNSLELQLLFIFLLVISIFLASLIIKIMYDEKMYKNTVDNLLDNNKYYLEVNNQDRVFKHNIIHRLNSIKSVGDKDANKLIDDLIDDYNLNSMPNMSIDILPNGINGIISRIIYGRKIDGLQIAVNNYLKSDLFSVLSPRKYNKLCESIGVCLDNALTATSSSKEKVLQVAILENKSSIIVKIINTFDSSLEVDKLGVMNYTTKKEGHGLGIYSLLGRKDVIVKTSIINDLFENQIIVKK